MLTDQDQSNRTSWAPLVYSRTYQADFRTRFLATPEDFTEADVDWAKSFVLPAVRVIEARYDRPPVWTVFKGRGYTVAGLACPSALLSVDHNRDWANAEEVDPSRENPRGRPLYGFFGWVTRDPSPAPPPMDVDAFRPLYQAVRDRWAEAETGENLRRRALSPYNPVPFVPAELVAASPNRDLGRVQVWASFDAPAVWSAVAASSGPASLAVGLPGRSDALRSPFDNAVFAGESAAASLERPRPEPEPQRAAGSQSHSHRAGLAGAGESRHAGHGRDYDPVTLELALKAAWEMCAFGSEMFHKLLVILVSRLLPFPDDGPTEPATPRNPEGPRPNPVPSATPPPLGRMGYRPKS